MNCMPMSALMRFILAVLVSLLVIPQSFVAAAPPPPPASTANVRTIQNLGDFPLAHLKMSLSPKLYKSLLISPLTAWLVAQAPTTGSPEPKIIHSEGGGVFDKLALEMAK